MRGRGAFARRPLWACERTRSGTPRADPRPELGRTARNEQPGAAMRLPVGLALLVVFIVAAVGLALLQRSSKAEPARDRAVSSGDHVASAAGTESFAGALPPNHPALSPATADSSFAPDESPPSLTWHAPHGWEAVPNRSPMRLATYRVPGPAGKSDDAELTVSRAGGSTSDNLERWVGQFDSAGPDKRAERMVAGLHVSTLEVSGTYEGGMTKSGTEVAHPGWALLGAVVEATGPHYFFKMVGPADSVRAARPGFDALLSSVRKGD
jgi:hypothetical protein